MKDLKPPWIRADLTGVADGTRTEHALIDLLEGFTQEAFECGAKPYQVIMAMQHIQYELEHKRLCGEPLESAKPREEPKVRGNGARKRVASITPLPVASAVGE